MYKKLLLLFSLGLAIFVSYSCTPESSMDNNTEDVEEIYYVKYASDELSTSNYYNITYSTEDGSSFRLSSIKGGDFERTIGPVSEGFNAEFKVECSASYPTTIAIRIEVKKGESPFVVKKESIRAGTGSVSAVVSYTIE